MSNKVVYNSYYGGFSLSSKAQELLSQLKGEEVDYHDLPRHDKDLVAVVEELGSEASGTFGSITIAYINSDRYRISEYDGWEKVITPEDENYVVIKEN